MPILEFGGSPAGIVTAKTAVVPTDLQLGEWYIRMDIPPVAISTVDRLELPDYALVTQHTLGLPPHPIPSEPLTPLSLHSQMPLLLVPTEVMPYGNVSLQFPVWDAETTVTGLFIYPVYSSVIVTCINPMFEGGGRTFGPSLQSG